MSLPNPPTPQPLLPNGAPLEATCSGLHACAEVQTNGEFVAGLAIGYGRSLPRERKGEGGVRSQMVAATAAAGGGGRGGGGGGGGRGKGPGAEASVL